MRSGWQGFRLLDYGMEGFTWEHVRGRHLCIFRFHVSQRERRRWGVFRGVLVYGREGIRTGGLGRVDGNEHEVWDPGAFNLRVMDWNGCVAFPPNPVARSGKPSVCTHDDIDINITTSGTTALEHSDSI